jgi:hypothetical protein
VDKIDTGDFESQNSNDGGANSSSLVAMTIVHPMVRDLAYSASNKAQNRVLKQAAAFNATIHTAASTQQYMYLLCPRPFGVSFNKLGQMAQKLGIDKCSEDRINNGFEGGS